MVPASGFSCIQQCKLVGLITRAVPGSATGPSLVIEVMRPLPGGGQPPNWLEHHRAPIVPTSAEGKRGA